MSVTRPVTSLDDSRVGDRVESVEAIATLARQRRSLVAPKSNGFNEPRPASWVLQFSAEVCLKLIGTGLYVYIPKSKASLKGKSKESK